MTPGIKASQKTIDPKTIFIDNSGLFELISKSRKKKSIELWKFITKEVIPTLFTKGTYTLPAQTLNYNSVWLLY